MDERYNLVDFLKYLFHYHGRWGGGEWPQICMIYFKNSPITVDKYKYLLKKTPLYLERFAHKYNLNCWINHMNHCISHPGVQEPGWPKSMYSCFVIFFCSSPAQLPFKGRMLIYIHCRDLQMIDKI